MVVGSQVMWFRRVVPVSALASGLMVAAVSLLAAGDAGAQSGPPNRNGPPQQGPRAVRAGSPAPILPTRGPVDLLDIRDRLERPEMVAITPAPTTPGIIACLAGCDGAAGRVAAVAAPKQAMLALVGPIEAGEPKRFQTASAGSVPVPVSATATDTVVCVAGCYENDRRSFAAKGGPQAPTTAATARIAAAANVTAAPTLRPSQSPDKSAPPAKTVTLKRTHAAHAVRRAPRTKFVQATGPAKQLPVIAVVGAPQPLPPAAPKAPATRLQPVVAHKKVAPKAAVVNTNGDWFNRIKKHQADKATAEPKAD